MKTEIAEIAAAGYFASGLNNAGEVRGIALAGYHVGISCAEIRTGLLEEIEASVRDHAVRVFVDSGAFAEVKPQGDQLVTVKPITDAEWRRRFEIYARIARAAGPLAYLVAPDKVGDQAETLARLERYGSVMRELRAMHGDPERGPNVIVPLQRGELAAADFAAAALEAIGMSEDEIVWGIPCKKASKSTAELEAFAATCQADAAFHLLGMGPSSPRFEATVSAILAHCPEARITCDAVRVTALVGRTNGPGGAPRALTVAQDQARAAGLSGRALKLRAIEKVIGAESVALLVDNGWKDPELAAAELEAQVAA